MQDTMSDPIHHVKQFADTTLISFHLVLAQWNFVILRHEGGNCYITNEDCHLHYITNEKGGTTYITNEKSCNTYITIDKTYITNEKGGKTYITNEKSGKTYITNEKSGNTYITIDKTYITNEISPTKKVAKLISPPTTEIFNLSSRKSYVTKRHQWEFLIFLL
jgi:hypothetical protein